VNGVRRQYAALLTSGAQLLLLFVGLNIGQPIGWVVVLALIAGISFLAWVSVYRRWRAVADTPTSQIASAAQGYVELAGRAENHDGIKVVARLSRLSCCWYRYRVERRSHNKKGWTLEDEGESVESFRLRDASGTCSVDPEGAEVLATRRNVWTEGDRRYTEWLILERDPLYALGDFATVGGAHLALNAAADVAAVLAEWKRDRRSLASRFDLDGDGEISMREWELARAEARREVGRTHAELRAAPGVHVLRRPRDGRLYLLANVDADRLAARFRLWTWLHLALFFGGVVGSVTAAARM